MTTSGLAAIRAAAETTTSPAALAAGGGSRSDAASAAAPPAAENAPAAVAALPAAAAAATDTSGVSAERTRAKRIMSSDAARGREDLAQYFAFDTDMSAEQAIAALERAPKAEAKPASRLDAAMANLTPKVAAGEQSDEEASRSVGLTAALTRQLKKIGKAPLTH